MIINQDHFFEAISHAELKLYIPTTAIIDAATKADNKLYIDAPDHWVWHLRSGTHVPAIGRQLGHPHLSRQGWDDNIDLIKSLYKDVKLPPGRRKYSWEHYAKRVDRFFTTVETDTLAYIDTLEADLTHLKSQIK